jgi:hypothetical protein
MNKAKCMMFIVCSLMISVVHGMELEKLNKLSISKDNIFVWSRKDRQYHSVTELGDVSEDNVLLKNDQQHTTYRAQLIIEEGAEGKKYSLKTIQKLIGDDTGTEFMSLKKDKRVVMPVSCSSEQCDAMQCRLSSCYYENRKKVILLIDNDNNEYFVTHVYYPQRNNTKTARLYDAQQYRTVEVSLVNKKEMLLKINRLEQRVVELEQLAKDLTQPTLAQTLQKTRDRQNSNALRDIILFSGVFLALYYAWVQLAVSNH